VPGWSWPSAHFLVALHAFATSATGTDALNTMTPPGLGWTSTQTRASWPWWETGFREPNVFVARKERATAATAAPTASLSGSRFPEPEASFADAGASASVRRRCTVGGDIARRRVRRSAETTTRGLSVSRQNTDLGETTTISAADKSSSRTVLKENPSD
jgi:hypothetical protein